MTKIKVLRTTDSSFEDNFTSALIRIKELSTDVESVVKTILKDVKENGDQSLFSYTEKYDGVRLDSSTLIVNPEDIEEAYKSLDSEEINALTLAAKRIEQFHQKQMNRFSEINVGGETVAEIVRPLQRVGLYIPGGKAPYPSSVLMSAIPARTAGVKDVVMVSPNVSSHVLAAAKIADVSCIYRVGGAQAIAALAYGTKSIPRVDKIAGPGNVYVETAKRLVFGEVGLDMLAGPSEILIVADDSAVPSFAAADFLAQAEHDENACPMLITTSESFLLEVNKEIFSQLKKLRRKEIAERSLEAQGIMILADNINEAVALANRIAPEHLELMVNEPNEVLKKITCAGAVFLGNYSPVTAGDYLAGPSHILPTGRTARFFSPLGVDDFLKRMSVISYSKDELMEIGDAAKKLALIEGLDAHAKAVEKRMSTKT
ncbi:MAG: histidinol dehydrogenase [Deltaproteobacteria bacterium]|jgi:histidinol dehydrogenase|nr:histidinol dehydrogenase [Deltaproteobacteria bacterium]